MSDKHRGGVDETKERNGAVGDSLFAMALTVSMMPQGVGHLWFEVLVFLNYFR